MDPEKKKKMLPQATLHIPMRDWKCIKCAVFILFFMLLACAEYIY